MEYGKRSGLASGAGQQQTVVVVTENPQPPVTGNGKPKQQDKTGRIAVPAMPMPAAVVCCILNFLIPGFGTICAGFSSFFCSRNEDIDSSGRFASCLIGWGIGCAQMALLFVFFLGWIWSCVWGVLFIGMSAKHYNNNRIAADGGNNGQRPGQNTIVVETSVTNQPVASNVQQPVGYAPQPAYPY